MRDYLRKVSVDGYVLTTWDTGRTDSLGKSAVGYQFDDPHGETLFEGEDFYCSPLHAIDSDEALRSLLGFLTLKPGDTDKEYFENYTPKQMAFAQGDAEYLQMYTIDDEPLEFKEL